MGKTVEQSLLEVMEEEELASLRAQQVHKQCMCVCYSIVYIDVFMSSVYLKRTVMLSWLRPSVYKSKKEDEEKRR